MICPRCNTELPDSATTCSQCGSPVSAAPAFSYLPSGAPQWPTMAPPYVPYQVPGLPAAQQPGFTPLAPVPAVPVRKSRLSIPVILVLFVASILVGGSATYGILVLQGRSNPTAQQQQQTTPIGLSPAAGGSTPTPTATVSPTAQSGQLPTPTSFKTGTSPDLGFSMQYPSDWVQDSPQSSPAGNKAIAFHPPTQAQLPVFLQVGQISVANSATVTSTAEVNQANITGFGSSNSLLNPQPVTNSPKQRKIGNVSWDEQDTIFTTGNGAGIHVVSLTVKHNKNYYNILFFAPSSVFDEAMTKYYTKMLNTFQFTA